MEETHRLFKRNTELIEREDKLCEHVKGLTNTADKLNEAYESLCTLFATATLKEEEVKNNDSECVSESSDQDC